MIELAPAEAKPEIAGLLADHLTELGVDEQYQYIPQYWAEPANRYAYLIRHCSFVAGFAFVRRTDRLEVAEFYVIPKFRRIGVGRSVLRSRWVRHIAEGSKSERIEFNFESIGAH